MWKLQFFNSFIFLLAGLSLGSTDKVWRRDTNFGNEENWEGFWGLCGKTIYSFDAWLNPSVISFPAAVSAKQILLPNDGHFVFQSPLTTFSDFDNETRASCPSRETKFKRNKLADWFDPSNWMDTIEGTNEAVGHVQRVPCGFDSVKFPENSSFSLLISSDVAIRKFFVGDKSLSYADVALFMSTKLGQIQFQKRPETGFNIDDNGNQDCDHDEECVCENYQDNKKRHICSLVECPSVADDSCPTPITPNGFCCPICGYHVKIQHASGFSLNNLKEKVKTELKDVSPSVNFYVARYRKNGIHIIFIPLPNSTAQTYKAVQVVRSYLKQQPQVVDVTVSRSWEHLDDTDKDSSSDGPGGPMLSLIIMTVLIVLVGLACLIFYWRKTGYPSMPSIWSSCPSLPRMQLPSRLIGSDSTPSFAFARFANERISHLNLGQAFEGGSLARAEAVDEAVATKPMTNTGNQGTSEQVEVAFAGDDYETIVHESPQDIMGKADSVTSSANDDHVYDLIEVTEDSGAILASSTQNLVSTTSEE